MFSRSSNGIQIRHPDHGQVIGESVIAGKYAVAQTAICRIATASPVFILAPILIDRIMSTSPNFFHRYPTLKLPVQLVVIGGLLMTALPCALAIFPPEGKLSTAQLEPKYHALKDKFGHPLSFVTYNKGL
jgi:sideroflexin-5